MRVGSLFTGYGGLDLAIGGELVWYAEIDKAACQVLATHHPNVANLGDITKINWADVEPVDILTGGYPCQPFSHAGKRKGKNDERHLWPYVLDAICAIRPRYAILENVSGHLSLGFDSVLTDLAEIGWFAEWGTYRASDVGAPHRRERLFIVACNPDNNGRPASERGRSLRVSQELWGSQESAGDRKLEGASDSLFAYATRGTRGAGSGRGVSESERATGLATHVGDIATDTSGDGHGEQLHAGAMAGVEGQATGSPQQRERSRRESDSRGVDDAADTVDNGLEHTSLRLEPQQGETATQGHWGDAADTEGTRLQRREPTAEDKQRGLAGRLTTTPRNRAITTTNWGKYAPAIRRWEAVLDRPAPAPTVERKDKRRLNPQFVEWMMGLPDGWVTGHGLSAAQELKMLGNGVVPQQARAAITQLLERTQQ